VLRKPQVVGGERTLRGIFCAPVEGEPEYFRVERRPNAMEHLTEDALTLLRAAREIHTERHGLQTFTLGTHLPLEEAGRRTGINPERLRYHDAIEELEYEGAIEWSASARYARGNKKYVITQRGLEMLRERG
jgi:hypothetical protein